MSVREPVPEVPGLVLGDVLGRGSTGPVWAAVDAEGRPRAVKVLPLARHGADGEDTRLELLTGRIRHDHLVRVHDVLEARLGTHERGLAVVMDRLDGGTLGQALAERGRLTPGELVTVLVPVASALGAVHALGVVHGDVSPGNVLLDRSGRPVLADLGVARVVGDASGDVHGTDGLVAPEVLSGGLPTPGADVHALAALAWWCLVGRPPGPALLREPLGDLEPGLPPALADLLTRALSPEPADRPGAAEFAAELFDTASPEPLRLTPGGSEATALTRRIRAAAEPVRVGEDPARRRLPGVRPVVDLVGGVVRGWDRVDWRPVGLAALAVALTVAGLGVLGARSVAAPDRPVAAPSPVAAAMPTTATPTTATPTTATTATVATSTGATGRLAPPVALATPARRPGAATSRVPTAASAKAALSALLTRRAVLWSAPDLSASTRPEALALVHAPGGASWREDARLLGSAAADGFAYRGVGFAVVACTPVRLGPERVVLDVRVDASAYVVVAPDGSSARRPARAGQVLVVTLERVGEDWRLAALRPR